MNFKKIIILLAASIVFIFASLASWYEGGQMRDISWEWKYSAVFSNWLNGEVTSPNEILVIDHFVYAAKFEPFFPLLMAASLVLIVFQAILWSTRNRKTVRTIFFLLMASLFFSLSIFVFNSPTTGLQLFAIFFGIVGMAALFLVFLSKDKRQSAASKVGIFFRDTENR